MKDARSYGKAFNDAGGGYYAVERASNHIKVWFWSRDAANVPAAVKGGAKSVDPDTWVSSMEFGFILEPLVIPVSRNATGCARCLLPGWTKLRDQQEVRASEHLHQPDILYVRVHFSGSAAKY